MLSLLLFLRPTVSGFDNGYQGVLMNAQQVILYHVRRARDFHSDSMNQRKHPSVRRLYCKMRDEHLAMAREVKRLSNMADAYEAL